MTREQEDLMRAGELLAQAALRILEAKRAPGAQRRQLHAAIVVWDATVAQAGGPLPPQTFEVSVDSALPPQLVPAWTAQATLMPYHPARMLASCVLLVLLVLLVVLLTLSVPIRTHTTGAAMPDPTLDQLAEIERAAERADAEDYDFLREAGLEVVTPEEVRRRLTRVAAITGIDAVLHFPGSFLGSLQ